MSSWFQSTNIASLAKNALKEAQKTIDKALDINQSPDEQEINGTPEESQINQIANTVTGAASDFFTAWGVAASLSPAFKNESVDIDQEEPLNPTKEPVVVTSPPSLIKNVNAKTNKSDRKRKVKSKSKSNIPLSIGPNPPNDVDSDNSFFIEVSSKSKSTPVNIMDEMVPIDLSGPSTALLGSPSLVNVEENYFENLNVTEENLVPQADSEDLGPARNEILDEPNESEGKESACTSDTKSPSLQATQTDNQLKSFSDIENSEPVTDNPTQLFSIPLVSEDVGLVDYSTCNNEMPILGENSTECNLEERKQIEYNDGGAPTHNSDNSEIVAPEISCEDLPDLSKLIKETASGDEFKLDQTNSVDEDTSSMHMFSGSESTIVAVTDLESSSGTIVQDNSDENDFDDSNLNEVIESNIEQSLCTNTIESNTLEGQDISPTTLSSSSHRISSISEEKQDFDLQSHSHSPTNSSASARSSPNADIPGKNSAIHYQHSNPSTPERGHSRSNSNSTSSSIDQQQHTTLQCHCPNVSELQLQNYHHNYKQNIDGKIVSNFPLSSASSSDIEVIPLDSLDSSMHMLYHAHTRRPSVTEVETQTDEIHTEAPPPQHVIPPKLTNLIAEKDLEIAQLREEGEKLSKKQFDLTTIIKKLRAKEKENESVVKGLKNEIDIKTTEVERVMKTFLQKESIEQKQVQTISKLNNEKTKLESTINDLRSRLEDSTENCASMKCSLEEASIEILELQNTISSAQHDTTQIDILTREKSDLVQQNQSFQREIEQLRASVSSMQAKSSSREQELKAQLSQHIQKIQELETQLSDASDEIADATMPLSVEIEKLQTELKTQELQFQKRERQLNDQLLEMNLKLKHSVEREKSNQDYQSEYKANIKQLETQIESLECDNRELKIEVETLSEDSSNMNKKYHTIETEFYSQQSELSTLRATVEKLEAELKAQKSLYENEKKKNATLVEQTKLQQLQDRSVSMNEFGSTSPVQTIKSNHSSTMSEASYLEEVFESNNTNNNIGNPSNYQIHNSMGMVSSSKPSSVIFDSLPTYNQASSTYIENLYGHLRHRENELIQLQSESTKNEKIRKTLNDEIAKLTVENQQLDSKLEQLSHVQSRLEEVEKNYNAVLQLYGEKVEEVEELRMDLADVKEMFKTQIEQLVRK